MTLESKGESILSSILDCLVNLTVLTVFYRKGDEQPYSNLIRACCRRTSLKGLHVREADLDLTVAPRDPEESAPGYFVVDHLVQAILGVHDLCLESFAHIASHPLHPSTFMALRGRATHLQTMVLRASIQSNLRMLFNEPTQWASASKLKKLVIRACAGVDCGSLVVHVANGVFGQLQRLSVIGCGYDRVWLEAITTPPKWTIGVLERLDIDHADRWEVMALSVIHVKEVYATRCFTTALIDALDAGGWPELQEVHTSFDVNGSEALLLELRRVFDHRRIILLIDAVPYGLCHCLDTPEAPEAIEAPEALELGPLRP